MDTHQYLADDHRRHDRRSSIRHHGYRNEYAPVGPEPVPVVHLPDAQGGSEQRQWNRLHSQQETVYRHKTPTTTTRQSGGMQGHRRNGTQPDLHHLASRATHD